LPYFSYRATKKTKKNGRKYNKKMKKSNIYMLENNLNANTHGM